MLSKSSRRRHPIICLHSSLWRSLYRNTNEPAILSLGGRSWIVTHVDWDHQTAHVAPVEHGGRSRWLGGSQPLRFELCQAIRRALLKSGASELWSKRAVAEVEQARGE